MKNLQTILVGVLALIAIDGDTIEIDGERIRLLGIDTPELHCQCARECELAHAAKTFTAEKIREGVRLERHGRDKYGRTLAKVYTREGDLAALLILEGLGRPYGGGKRRSWCD